jgi:hypothetical protein
MAGVRRRHEFPCPEERCADESPRRPAPAPVEGAGSTGDRRVVRHCVGSAAVRRGVRRVVRCGVEVVRAGVDRGRCHLLGHCWRRGRRGLRCWVVPAFVGAAEFFGVASGEAPGAVPGVFATELLICGRIATRPGPVTHGGQFGDGEQSQLPHIKNCPRTRPPPPPPDAADHFKWRTHMPRWMRAGSQRRTPTAAPRWPAAVRKSTDVSRTGTSAPRTCPGLVDRPAARCARGTVRAVCWPAVPGLKHPGPGQSREVMPSRAGGRALRGR